MLDTLQMSLRYKLNNVGPRIEPCGTPHIIHYWEDLVPLSCTYCFLYVK